MNRHIETLEDELLPAAEGSLSTTEADDIGCDFLLYEPLQTTIAGPSISYRQAASAPTA